MAAKIKDRFCKVEVIIAIIIVVMAVLIGAFGPEAFSMNTVFNMLRSAIVPGIFAAGALMVLISGGMDVSFTYIAPAAAYTTVVLLERFTYTGTVLLPILTAGVIGMFLGMVNGWLIARYDFPALIVTLGTGTAIHGAAVCFVGSRHITKLPGQMLLLSRTNLFTVNYADGSKGGLNITILITVFVFVMVWFLLNKTLWGRGIYAIGGSKSAAVNVGYNVKGILFSMYALVGALSGVAGIVYMSLNRQANPHLMVGTELDVIAAVILGGVSVAGGKGSVLGTVLGLALLTMMNNCLILVGIPTQWQKAMVGVMILFGTALPILVSKQRKGGGR